MPHPANIPLTPQTNEANFPRWQDKAPPGESGAHYPKMLTRLCTSEDRDEWIKRNRRRDQNTGQDYFEYVAPLVGSPIPVVATAELVNAGLVKNVGEPVIVRDKDHEAEIVAKMGLEPVPVKIPIPVAKVPMRDLEAENQELRDQLASGRPENKPPAKRRGRPRKVHAADREISREI